MVLVDYLHWQFVAGPRWLLEFFWNLEKALLQFFSVPVLLKTLFSYWRRDKVPLIGNGMQGLIEGLAWNTISRLIGFIIRSFTLAFWLIAQVVAAVFAVVLFVLFLLWPFIALGLISSGLVALL